MGKQQEIIRTGLEDAGCAPGVIEKAERLLAAGQTQELIRFLCLCRCDLMEDLHKSQKRVDCMDYLLRQTEKQLLKNK